MPVSENCSRDGCPPKNIQSDAMANCVKCKSVVHLPCIGIFVKLCQIAVPNVKIYCNGCLKESTPKLTSKTTPKTSISSIKSQTQSQSLFDLSANKKLDDLLKLTRDIHNSVIGVNTPSPNGSNKSFAAVLKSIDEKTSKVKETTDALKNQQSLSKTPLGSIRNIQRRLESNFPHINSPITKRKRTDLDATSSGPNESDNILSNNIKHRNLITASGNSSNIIRAAVINDSEGFTRNRFTKSIYATRFNTTVTVANISDYIKEKIVDVAAEDFVARLLVKKDQQMDRLTFVSFRILCTEELYTRLKTPDFWPSGIQIGDFHVKPIQHTLASMIQTESQTENLVDMVDANKISPSKNVPITQSTVNLNPTPTGKEVLP